MDQTQVEEMLAEVVNELRKGAMGAKTNPKQPRVEPLAIVLAEHQILTVTFLDLSQRVATIRRAVQQHDAYAFTFLYDGFIERPNRVRVDALIEINGTRWRAPRATAQTYTRAPLGAVFGERIERDDVAEPYAQVFEPQPAATPSS